MHNLAADYRADGRRRRRSPCRELVLKLRESKLGPDHPDTCKSRREVAAAYRTAGRTAEAFALEERTLKQL